MLQVRNHNTRYALLEASYPIRIAIDNIGLHYLWHCVRDLANTLIPNAHRG